jgi:hypothetical protein
MTEVATLNGTSAVVMNKAFYVVISYQPSAALAGNLSLGTGVLLGLPFFLPGKASSAGAGYIVREVMDAALATAGTFVGGDLTIATGTTGDIRGTWSPNTAPNGTHIYELVMSAAEVPFLGVPQYAL